MTCPRCGERMKFERYRSKKIASLMGEVVYERACYGGCACEKGWYPTDELFGLTQATTPGAAEVITLQGSLSAFDEAANKVLPKSSGLNVSASTVRRITEQVGRDLSERRREKETFGESTEWDWQRDAKDQRCGYVSLDATGVRQQAEDGSATEGRMPWVGEVFNPTPRNQKKRGRIWEARYLAGLMPLPEMGRQLLREARAVGLDQADVVIGLTDGGNGLEDCLLDEVFAKLGKPFVFILDFFHVCEHLCEFAQQAYCGEQVKAQSDRWCHMLKHQGGRAVLEDVKHFALADCSAAVQESHRQLCGYLRNNLHRMDYPRYLRNGWHIGSGSIESACKNVINARLNGTGMRWLEHGTNEMAHVRALFKSEPTAWDTYWTRPHPAAAA